MEPQKNGIIESNNKNASFLANSLIFTPKNQSLDLFSRFFKIVLLNFCQLFLSIKKFEKKALKSKIKNTAYSANFLNSLPESTKLNIFSS